MTTATRNAGSSRMGIALIVMVLYGIAMAVLANVPIPEANKDAFMMLIGNLGPLTGGVVGYYFNISRRSNGA